VMTDQCRDVRPGDQPGPFPGFGDPPMPEV
jgi:hypothetical protein